MKRIRIYVPAVDTAAHSEMHVLSFHVPGRCTRDQSADNRRRLANGAHVRAESHCGAGFNTRRPVCYGNAE